MGRAIKTVARWLTLTVAGTVKLVGLAPGLTSTSTRVLLENHDLRIMQEVFAVNICRVQDPHYSGYEESQGLDSGGVELSVMVLVPCVTMKWGRKYE